MSAEDMRATMAKKKKEAIAAGILTESGPSQARGIPDRDPLAAALAADPLPEMPTPTAKKAPTKSKAKAHRLLVGGHLDKRLAKYDTLSLRVRQSHLDTLTEWGVETGERAVVLDHLLTLGLGVLVKQLERGDVPVSGDKRG